MRHALQQEVNHAPEEEKIALIEAHPDLVGRAVLTAESQGEQASAGLTDLSADEVDAFVVTMRLTARSSAFPSSFVRG